MQKISEEKLRLRGQGQQSGVWGWRGPCGSFGGSDTIVVIGTYLVHDPVYSPDIVSIFPQ